MKKETVKLTIVVLDAEIKLSVLLIGFFSEMGYSAVKEKTRAKPGKLSFVYKKKDEVRNERSI